MAIPPKPSKKKYTVSKQGTLGKIGSEDTQINYIQTSFPMSELDNLGLVCEIPGSEQWPIRQLFQRDIDIQRVTNEIIPYFKQNSKVKFFNPLTIAVLPIDINGQFEQGHKECEEVPDEQHHSKSYAIDTFYKVSYDDEEPCWAEIKWDPKKVKLVAIDGQHRLSALKRLFSEYSKDPTDEALVKLNLPSWTIPVIIVTVGHVCNVTNTYSALNKTRDIFVTINKQAKAPSRCRTILLNDYSVSAICAQELLDNCISGGGLPLAIFDWRESKDADKPEFSTTLARIDEVEDWLLKYLLGDNSEASGELKLTDQQAERLFIPDNCVDYSCLNDHDLRELIKTSFESTLMPAINYIFENIKPYNEYISSLSEMINKPKDDIDKHAWSTLIYGTDFAHDSIRKQVIERKIELLEFCNTSKDELGRQFKNAIGIRGIMSGFSHYTKLFWDTKEIKPWAEMAEKYVSLFNLAFENKIFSSPKLIRHLVFDHSDSIVNYQLSDVHKSFGLLCSYAVIYLDDVLCEDDCADCVESLYKALYRGYKKEVRPSVKDDLIGSPIEKINEEINLRAEKKAKKQLRLINKALKGI